MPLDSRAMELPETWYRVMAQELPPLPHLICILISIVAAVACVKVHTWSIDTPCYDAPSLSLPRTSRCTYARPCVRLRDAASKSLVIDLRVAQWALQIWYKYRLLQSKRARCHRQHSTFTCESAQPCLRLVDELPGGIMHCSAREVLSSRKVQEDPRAPGEGPAAHAQVAAFLAPYQRAATLLRAQGIPQSRAGNPFARNAPWKREVQHSPHCQFTQPSCCCLAQQNKDVPWLRSYAGPVHPVAGYPWACMHRAVTSLCVTRPVQDLHRLGQEDCERLGGIFYFRILWFNVRPHWRPWSECSPTPYLRAASMRKSGR